jgi:hypothetical protein
MHALVFYRAIAAYAAMIAIIAHASDSPAIAPDATGTTKASAVRLWVRSQISATSATRKKAKELEKVITLSNGPPHVCGGQVVELQHFLCRNHEVPGRHDGHRPEKYTEELREELLLGVGAEQLTAL